jgi:SAM-dependent methyltransferase
VPTDLRRDWDARGRADALFHVDATRVGWTASEFYARGPVLVSKIVDPVLALMDVDPSGGCVLEIGCGVGRLFAGLAERFDEVWGIDVSPEMVARGQATCPADARWLVGEGYTLGGVDDASIDHVLSFEVFQHIPERAVIGAYLAETYRVLRPGGTFQFQLRSGNDSTRQAVLRALPRPLRATTARAAQIFRLTRVTGDVDSWIGCVVPIGDAVTLANDLTFQDVTTLPDDLHAPGMGYWLVGRKPS